MVPCARAMLLKVSPDLTVYVPPVEVLPDEVFELEDVLEVLLEPELLPEFEEVLELLDELLPEAETFRF